MPRIGHRADRDVAIRDHPDYLIAVANRQNTDIKLAHEAGGVDECLVGSDALRVRCHDLPDLHRTRTVTRSDPASHQVTCPRTDGKLSDAGVNGANRMLVRSSFLVSRSRTRSLACGTPPTNENDYEERERRERQRE